MSIYQLTKASMGKMSHIIELLLHESSSNATIDLLLNVAVSLYAITIKHLNEESLVNEYISIHQIITSLISWCIHVCMCMLFNKIPSHFVALYE